MRTTPVVPFLALTLLLVTGCSEGGDDEAADTPDSGETDARSTAREPSLRADDPRVAVDRAAVLTRLDEIEVHPGELHLSRGAASLRPVREILDTLDPATLAAVQADLAGELDGVVEPWTSTTICESSGTVAGPERARCAALDGACARGRLRAAETCCDLEPAPAGTLCEAGVCDGLGACEAREPTAEERRLGVYAWVEPLTPGVPTDWDGERVVLRIDEASIVDMPRDEARSARSRLAATGPDAAFGAALYDGAGADRHLRVAGTADTDEVCVVTGPVDEHPWIASDCTSAGAVVVSCPGASGGYRCDVESGAFIVRSEGDAELPTLAWQRSTAPVVDVVGAMGVATLCVDPTRCTFAAEEVGALADGEIVALATCSFPSTTVCTLTGATGACSGTRSCTILGTWGPCRTTPETNCNGQDEDCDGVIDDGASMGQCNDGRSCTGDVCSRSLWGGNFYFCTNWPFPDSCAVGDDCAVPVCMGTTLAGATSLDPATDTYSPATPDANGCQQRLRNSWCEARDQCACNGNNQCDPGAAGTDDVGCRGGRALCDLDDNVCTRDKTCCEPNDACVLWGSTSQFDKDQAQDACERAAGGLTDTVSGRTAACAPGPACPLDRVDCSDGNPCTQDLCNPVTGACSHPPTGIMATPGCGHPTDPDGRCGPLQAPLYPVLVEQGCGTNSCNSTGACELRIAPGSPTTTSECQGDPGSGGFASCLREQCSAGRCIAVPQNTLCPDEFDCTVDTCNPSFTTGGSTPVRLCQHTFPGGCAIDGMCVPAGTSHPTDQCLECRPSTSTTSWSPSPASRMCVDGQHCTNNDRCNGGGTCIGMWIDGCVG